MHVIQYWYSTEINRGTIPISQIDPDISDSTYSISLKACSERGENVGLAHPGLSCCHS